MRFVKCCFQVRNIRIKRIRFIINQKEKTRTEQGNPLGPLTYILGIVESLQSVDEKVFFYFVKNFFKKMDERIDKQRKEWYKLRCVIAVAFYFRITVV